MVPRDRGEWGPRRDASIVRRQAAVGSLTPQAPARALLLLQVSLEESVQVWDELVCEPSTTLVVVACARPVLLQLVSALVDLHTASGAQGSSNTSNTSEARLSVALINALELAPSIKP